MKPVRYSIGDFIKYECDGRFRYGEILDIEDTGYSKWVRIERYVHRHGVYCFDEDYLLVGCESEKRIERIEKMDELK